MAKLDWYIRAQLKPRHLQLLVALDDLRRTSKVAALLNVSQPAVSKTLGELESGLGLRLFERTANGLVPNASGEVLVRHARQILNALSEAGDELHALSHGVAGKTRLGALPGVAAVLVPRALVHLKNRSAATTVFVREATMDSLLTEMRAGAIDLVAGTLPARGRGVDLDEEVLFEDRTTVVARHGHRLSQRRRLELAELAGCHWVLPPRDSLLRDALSAWFQECGMPTPASVVETLSVSVIRAYLAGSDAVATLPASISSRLASEGVLSVLPLTPPPLVRPVGMTWLKDRAHSPSTRLMMESLRAAAAP